ncbi:MAG: zf-HC2 domain-containing protein [candidate division NC10 bacterium]|nr:zf-HC2 domain-containing protein [candidate division NC10 bacterium]
MERIGLNGKGAPFWRGLRLEALVTMLRVALGAIFVIGGLKLVHPAAFGIPGQEALALKFLDPEMGYISPFIAAKIIGTLGVRISTFLLIQGWVEIVLGVLLVGGVGTRMVAMNMGLMFWAFTVASPLVGQLRLSRDLALMGLSFAIAVTGADTWSLEGHWRGRRSQFADRRDVVLVLIRFSLAYPLIVSALFTGGAFDNPLNGTLPRGLILLVGLLLAAGVLPRGVMLLVALWMLFLLPATLATKGIFQGLDVVKREIGLFAASLAYLVAGPDRWTWPKPRRLRCRDVVDLLLAYVEDSLRPMDRRAFEAHIVDCINCWRILKTYRETMALGRQLGDDTIPMDVHERLDAFVRGRLSDPS